MYAGLAKQVCSCACVTEAVGVEYCPHKWTRHTPNCIWPRNDWNVPWLVRAPQHVSSDIWSIQAWTCLHATRSFCFKYYLKTSIYVYESIAMPCYSCFFKTIITSFKVFALWICILTLLPCILCLNPLVLLSKVLHLPTLFLNNLMHQYILRQNNIHKLENVIQIIQYAYTSMHLWSFCISPMHNIFQKIIKFIKHLHRKYHKANKEKNVMHKPNP